MFSSWISTVVDIGRHRSTLRDIIDSDFPPQITVTICQQNNLSREFLCFFRLQFFFAFSIGVSILKAQLKRQDYIFGLVWFFFFVDVIIELRRTSCSDLSHVPVECTINHLTQTIKNIHVV